MTPTTIKTGIEEWTDGALLGLGGAAVGAGTKSPGRSGGASAIGGPSTVGPAVGAEVGPALGAAVGPALEEAVGATFGAAVGAVLGAIVGAAFGAAVGAASGAAIGLTGSWARAGYYGWAWGWPRTETWY